MNNDPAQLSDLDFIFENVVATLLSLGALALFIMLISGGFKYLTAAGDPKATESAQKTLTYAIGGLILLAGSFMILSIIQTITGVEVTNFVIYKP